MNEKQIRKCFFKCLREWKRKKWNKQCRLSAKELILKLKRILKKNKTFNLDFQCDLREKHININDKCLEIIFSDSIRIKYMILENSYKINEIRYFTQHDYKCLKHGFDDEMYWKFGTNVIFRWLGEELL